MLWVTTDSAWHMWSVLYTEAVECMNSAESVCHVGVSVVNFLLLLNMAHMVCLACGRLLSEQC